jgi:hypothetical protein
MLQVSAHFAANHPAFAAHRGVQPLPPPAAATAAPVDADADDADYVLAMSPEWAAKLKQTIERLRARDGGGQPRKKAGAKKKKKRNKAADKAPPPPPAADLEALAAAAREYAAARSDDVEGEPQARTIAAPDDAAAEAAPTLTQSLENRRDQLLSWVGLS